MGKMSIMGFELSENDSKRFWSKVCVKSSEDCWEWTAALHKLGYGQFRVGGKYGKIVSSHRVAVALSGDLLDEEKHCLHICDNRKCCNPMHIRLGDHTENMKDASIRNRMNGVRVGNGHTKVPKEKYKEIIKLMDEGVNKSKIGRIFGVTPTNIRHILKKVEYGKAV
jgi:hypothetical protein